MIIIVTGVSGSGKTTVGTLLSKQLFLPFFDADDFHPHTNVDKMTRGIPLTDHDRMPWLENLAENMTEWERNGGAILACSALREKYREILGNSGETYWIHLKGEKELLHDRLVNRQNHYMNPDLLSSQLDTWEEPSYGLHLDVREKPEQLVTNTLNYLKEQQPVSHIGIIGMGVMGKSLAMNMAENGVPTAVFNRYVAGSEENIASNFAKANASFTLLNGYDELKPFLNSLKSPRQILLMIPAGEAIDKQIEQLLPELAAGDVLIDGGNSFYEDSNRRFEYLKSKGIQFLPMGISGGEEGARKGPSLMPGGSKTSYDLIAPILKKIAAKDKEGNPCVTWVGPEGAGHFVKMVHNSIEYGEMQVLAETIHLFRHGLRLSPIEISRILKSWLNEGLKSYLLEISAEIYTVKEGDEFLVDSILDKAGQKGTGGWSVATALKHHVPYSPLAEALTARQLSANKENRSELSKVYNHRFRAFAEDKVLLMERIKNAYTLTRIINHETGFNLMKSVSDAYGWQLNFSEIARIWTNGCIIRSTLMEDLVEHFATGDELLKNKKIGTKIKELKSDFTYIIGLALQHDFPVPVMSGAANYFFGRIVEDSSANIIQAQRDYFGAHTYQKKSDPTGKAIHTDWLKVPKAKT